MYIQCPDGLIVNFEHVVKIRKLDYVQANDENLPLLWLKFATGEEEKVQFDSRQARDSFYRKLKNVLQIRSLDE